MRRYLNESFFFFNLRVFFTRTEVISLISFLDKLVSSTGGVREDEIKFLFILCPSFYKMRISEWLHIYSLLYMKIHPTNALPPMGN